MISEELKSKIRQEVHNEIDLSREVEDEEIKDLIHLKVLAISKESYLSLQEKSQLSKQIFDSIRKLDLLQELVEDETITEIMINGTDDIFVERAGRIEQLEKHFETKEKLEDVIQQVVAGCNRVVNESVPIADARLENGSRVNIVLYPIAINGPIVTIRRFSTEGIKMEDLIRFGSISIEAAHFLRKAVISGYNIFISGGTGSGKTTFLNALSEYIPRDERVITIEDSAELQIQGIDNLIRLETRNATAEGCKEISIRDLIKTALRMRPDRIIVGEIRGAEAIDMLQAFNTGHDGSLSTGHANSASDMISRMETMVLMGIELPLPAIRRQIASGIDIIVHLGRMRDKSRKVLGIWEVNGMKGEEVDLRPLFMEETDREGNYKLIKANSLRNTEKMIRSGEK